MFVIKLSQYLIKSYLFRERWKLKAYGVFFFGVFYDFLCLVVHFLFSLHNLCCRHSEGSMPCERFCLPQICKDCKILIFFSVFPNRLHHNLVPLEINIYYREQCFFAVTLEATWYLQNTFLLGVEMHWAHLWVTSDVCLSWFMRSYAYYREEK